MQTFNVHEAKSQLSKLLNAVDEGEQIEIMRSGKAYRLVPVDELPPQRPFGALRGKIQLQSNWDAADINAQIASEMEAS